MSESVNHPEHYGGDVAYEAIKVIEACGLGVHLGNAVKYIVRAGKTEGADRLVDLNKARWYISRAMSMSSDPHSNTPDFVAIEKLWRKAKDGL